MGFGHWKTYGNRSFAHVAGVMAKKPMDSLSDIQERRKPTCLYGFKII